MTAHEVTDVGDQPAAKNNGLCMPDTCCTGSSWSASTMSSVSCLTLTAYFHTVGLEGG